MNDVAQALADPIRRDILRMLRDRPVSAGAIAGAFDVTRPAVSRHLRVLREAGLVEERRPDHDRRVRLYTLRADPVRELGGWLDGLGRGWQARLEAFADHVALRTDRPRGAP